MDCLGGLFYFLKSYLLAVTGFSISPFYTSFVVWAFRFCDFSGLVVWFAVLTAAYMSAGGLAIAAELPFIGRVDFCFFSACTLDVSGEAR